MTSQPDGEFDHILIYQDDVTKFSVLKPLQGKEPENVSNGLIDIFCTVGTTLIVSGRCTEFAHQVTREMRRMWPGCFVVVGRAPSHSEHQYYQTTADGVKESLMRYMDEKRTERWSRGLRLVQWGMNQADETYNNRQSTGGLSERALLGVSNLLDCKVYETVETEEGLVNAMITQKNQHSTKYDD